MNNKCYKCKTTKDLVIKRRLKNDGLYLVCRPCRNEGAHQYYLTQKAKRDVERKTEERKMTEWRERAKASHLKILERIQ